MRNLVFISHANPEENQFARWLGLRLVRNGYAVWSDVTKLIGGESFWDDIENAIRTKAAKFLFVLSRSSNKKQGTLDELHLGRTVARQDNVKDFVIPLRVDDLPFAEINVALHRLTVIDFTPSWATGLNKVLEKLALDDVPTDLAGCNPATVAAWWRSSCEGSGVLRDQPEELLSNWFPLTGLPAEFQIHKLSSRHPRIDRGRNDLPFPGFPIRNLVVSFASANALDLQVLNTTELPLFESVAADVPNSPLNSREARNALTYLLRAAWKAYVKSVPLPLYAMSQDRECGYFTPNMFDSKLVSFDIPGFMTGRRGLVGQAKQKHWHFAISADVVFQPTIAYCLRSHVLFSDDGQNIWNSPDRLHRSRRSACKMWWNDKWRDLLLAALYWLARKQGAQGRLEIPLSPNSSVEMSIRPVEFRSPVSFAQSAVAQNPYAGEPGIGEDGEVDDVEGDE